jgi:N-acetylglutamate synthase-like GNAT family acetyltransferase
MAYGGLIRDASPTDRTWITNLLEQCWGSTTIVSRGRSHRADQLPALVADSLSGLCGLATYRVEGTEAELVTLNAEPPGRGIGTALLSATIDVARRRGRQRAWLITTNDNLDAVAFYQSRGLRLVAVHRGAVDEARRLKPQIPEVGPSGLPIHDELEMAVEL